MSAVPVECRIIRFSGAVRCSLILGAWGTDFICLFKEKNMQMNVENKLSFGLAETYLFCSEDSQHFKMDSFTCSHMNKLCPIFFCRYML